MVQDRAGSSRHPRAASSRRLQHLVSTDDRSDVGCGAG